jgi:hypothetical protein
MNMPDLKPVSPSLPTVQALLRTINVEVPETVYWHVRQCAIASRLSMKDYMAKFCQEAWAYPPEGNGVERSIKGGE